MSNSNITKENNVYNQGFNQNCNNLDLYSTESLNNGYN